MCRGSAARTLWLGDPARSLQPTVDMGDPVRVLIVDDDPLVRRALAEMLTSNDRVQIVDQVKDGSEVLAAVDAHHPEVVLMDLAMPGVDGITATELLCRQPRAPRVLVLTAADRGDVALLALRKGAVGFLHKDSGAEVIIRAVEQAAAGEPTVSPVVLRRLIAHVAGDADAAARRERARQSLDELSDREREVALAIGEGKRNAQIASDLHMSVATVKAHVGRIFVKLAVENRVQIAILVHDAAGTVPGA